MVGNVTWEKTASNMKDGFGQTKAEVKGFDWAIEGKLNFYSSALLFMFCSPLMASLRIQVMWVSCCRLCFSKCTSKSSFNIHISYTFGNSGLYGAFLSQYIEDMIFGQKLNYDLPVSDKAR